MPGLALSFPNHDQEAEHLQAYWPQVFVAVVDMQKPESSGSGGEMSSVNGAMCDTQKAEISGRHVRKSSPWLSCYPAPETYVSVPRSGRRVVEKRLAQSQAGQRLIEQGVGGRAVAMLLEMARLVQDDNVGELSGRPDQLGLEQDAARCGATLPPSGRHGRARSVDATPSRYIITNSVFRRLVIC